MAKAKAKATQPSELIETTAASLVEHYQSFYPEIMDKDSAEDIAAKKRLAWQKIARDLDQTKNLIAEQVLATIKPDLLSDK